MTATAQSGRCACGAPVRRDIPGRFEHLGELPLVCDGCIAEIDASERREEERRRAGRVKARLALRIERSGIPAALQGVTLRDREQAEAIAGWPDERPYIALLGPVGAGKTMTAAAAAGRLVKTMPVRWTSAPQLMARLGSGFDTPARDQALELLTGEQPLVLDDLDKTRPTAYGAEQIFAAVDGRVSAGVPLLVTSNLTLGELARQFPEPWGEALASRLAGHCVVHRFEGPDLRLGSESS